jgi:hypothetical protein
MGDADACRHFIPLARGELTALLCADPDVPEPEREAFRALCDLVGATYHFEYSRRFQGLMADYTTFDPDTDDTALLRLSAGERQARRNRLYRDIAWLLERAGFRHLSRGELEPVLDRASDWGVRVDVDFSAFEHAALFARGEGWQRRVRRRLRTLYREEETEVPVHRRLVIMLKLRDHPRLPTPVDTENVFLKLFKEIPKLDVTMLLPGSRVRIRPADRGRIGLSLLGGLGLAVYKFLSELMDFMQTLFLTPSAAWGLAAAGIGYTYRSFYGYVHTKQRYHLALTKSLYFQNLDNNAGVLTRLIDEAEEQDWLATVLGYYCLWRHGSPEGRTADDLDTLIELYLDRSADVQVACEPGQALAKLKRLQLAEEVSAGRYRAAPLPQALAALHANWDGYFAHPLPGAAP